MRRELMILFGFGLMTFFFSCNEKKSKPTLILIPEDYLGEVIIVYDYKDGEDKKQEGDKRILEIDNNGILRTKFKATYGVSLDKFFHVSSKGQRRLIRRAIDVTDPNELCIYNGSSSKKTIDGKEYELQVFAVCLKKNVQSYHDMQVKLD